jgi:hypothetical protein
MIEERESERQGEGEELERDDMPESAKEAVEGHGSEGRGGESSTPPISEEGEHGQTQVSGDPGEPPDEK